MGLDMGLMSDIYLELKMGLKLKMYVLRLELDIWGMELRSEMCLKFNYLKVDVSHKLEVGLALRFGNNQKSECV